MKLTRRPNTLRFFAGLTILSVTFAQAAPAWALRQGIEGTTQAGVEERLLDRAGSVPTGLSVLIAKIRSDPLWIEPAPGWNPDRPLDNDREALQRLERLFKKHSKDLSDPGQWGVVIASMLDPTNETIAQQLLARPAPEVWCPSCGAYAARHPRGESDPGADSAALRFDEAWMAARHAVEHDEVRSVGPAGESQTDFNDIRMLAEARGLSSEGVVLRGSGEKIFRQALSILLQHPEDARGITLAVLREENGQPMDHAITLVNSPDGRIFLLDRDRRFEVSIQGMDLRTFARLNPPRSTALLWTFQPDLELGRVLPKGARRAEPLELDAQTVCCGVVNFPSMVSSEELDRLGLQAVPAFSTLDMGKAAIRLLEPRGFDNASLMIKYEIPLKNLRGIQPVISESELQEWARKNQVYLVRDPKGQLTAIRFFGVARVTGSATANQKFMEEQIQARMVRVVSEFFQRLGFENVQVQKDPFSADWIVRQVTAQVGQDKVVKSLARVSSRGTFYHTRFATKGGYQLANAHYWVASLGKLLGDSRSESSKNLSALLGIDFSKLSWQDAIWTLSHNGDWETYDWVRVHFEKKLGISFEGTTDSEVMLYLLLLLSITKVGNEIKVELPEAAVTRLFRLIDVLEVLKAAALQLDAVEKEIRAIRLALESRQWSPDRAAEVEREKADLERELKQARAQQAHDDVLKPLEAKIEDIQNSLGGRKWSPKTAQEKEKRARELAESAEKVRQRLGSNGFEVQNRSLLPTVPLGSKKLSEEFIAILERSLQDPSMLDRLADEGNGWMGYYAFPGSDKEMRGLGADLAESAPPDFRKAFGKGLNITIQLSSLNDPYGGVIARTYPKSTAGYLVVGRNEAGEIDRVANLSEVRGAAPQMGHEDRRVQLAKGIYVIYGSAETLDIPGWSVYTLDGLKVQERQVWNGVSRDVVLNEEVRRQDTAWIHVDPEGEDLYNSLSAFELEAMVQQVTITETTDRYTREVRGLWAPDVQRVEISDGERKNIKAEIARLKKERSTPRLGPKREANLAARILVLEKQLARADGTGLTAEALRRLSDRKGKVVKGGSGSSTFMMEIADAEDPYADIIQSSDDLRLNLPPYLFDADTTLVIATQSGETGSARELAEILLDRAGESDNARLLATRTLALHEPDETARDMAARVAAGSKESPEAKKLAENILASADVKTLEGIAREVVKKGGLVIVITNSPGSSLFKIGQKSGGVLLTRSTPESAIAASGTTSHTVVLDRLVGIAVGQVRGEITAGTAHQKIELMRRHGTRSLEEGEKPGTLAKVLNGFFLNQEKPTSLYQNDSFYQRAVHIMEYMKHVSMLLWREGQPGHGEDIRPVNITVIGRNATGARLAKEVNLKMAEEIGKPGWPISMSEFLEWDIGVHNGELSPSHRPVRPVWNPATVIQTIRDNRDQFATLDGFILPEDFPGRVLIVGNAADLIPMSLIRAAYQDVFPVPLKVMTYEEASTQGDKTYQPAEDTLVIFVRPGEGMVPGAGEMDLASETIRRWNLPKDHQIHLYSANPSEPARALRDSSQLHNVRELKGEPQDLYFAVVAALDSLTAQLSLKLIAGHPEYGEEWKETARAAVSERQSSREAAVGTGILETIASVSSDDGDNRFPLNQIIEFASARSGHMGWANFNIWPAGYGVREWLGRDFAVLARLVLGKSVFPEQPSNGSHGNYGAMHPGAELVLWYPPVGPTEQAAYDEDFKKKVEEVIPRAVNHPFPSDREPGFFVLMGTRDQQAERGPGEHFVDLRRLRHQALDRTTLQDGTVLEMTTPDAVLATPHGDLFEILVLNRLVADRLARARADLLAGKGKQNAQPGELVINIDPGLPGPERSLYYEQLRKRFPVRQATIVTFTGEPADEQYLHENSDHVFLLPTGGPVEILSAVHGLSAVLARERYVGLAERAAPVAQAINKELKLPDRGIFGPPASDKEGYDDPDPRKQKFLGAVEIIRLYATYASRDPSSLKPNERVWQDRIKRAISRLETKHLSTGEVLKLLEDAVEIYRVQLVPVFGFAHEPKELIKYLIFQIQGLAKVVTNLGGISIRPEYRREDPNLLSTTLGSVADGRLTSEKMVPLIVDAMQDNPVLEDGLRSVLGILRQSPLASADTLTVASLFWKAVGGSLRQIAQNLLSQMPDHRYTKLTLGLGYPAAAATNPETGGFVLDLLALASPELTEQLIEDEMRHIRYQSTVQSLQTDLVVLEGVPVALAGQSQSLIRQALAEATFLMGQAHRFHQTVLPAQRLNIIGLLEGYAPFQADPSYANFMLLPGGKTDYSENRFWEAMRVVAETPVYGEVSVMAGLLLLEQERVSSEVWQAAYPLVEAIEKETLVTAAGAEEHLSWKDQIDAYDPVAAITEAIRTSEVLRSIAEVNDQQKNAKRVRSARRVPSPAEVEQLEKQGNTAADWSRVHIWDDATADYLKRIRNNRFYGDVEIGVIGAGEVTLPDGRTKYERGIYGSILRNVRIGANPVIEKAEIANYVLKDDVVVSSTRLIADPQTTFGLQKYYEIRNEAGKRELPVYPEMRLQGALKLSNELLYNTQLAADYKAQHDDYVRRARSDFGIVESGAVIDRVSGDVVNSYIGAGAVISQAQHVREAVILSGFSAAELIELGQLAEGTLKAPKLLPGLKASDIADLKKDYDSTVARLIWNEKQEKDPTKRYGRRTRVESAAQVEYAVFKPGVHVASAAQLTQAFADENSIAEQGVNITAMYVGPDSHFAKGEFGSVFAEPFVVSHHKASLNLGSLLSLGTNIGSAGQTSNHDGLGPEQEALFARGMFIGTGVVAVYPLDLSKSPHSLLQTGIQLSPRQAPAFPFMLMGQPAPGAIQGYEPERAPAVEGRRRAYNEVVPGWVLKADEKGKGSYLYLVLRNEDKWGARQKSLGYKFNFEIFQPDVVDLMVQARANLEDVEEMAEFYYGERSKSNPNGIVGLGHNYMSDKNRLQGIQVYTRFIRYYALQGLYRQLNRLQEAGSLDAASVDALLNGPAQTLRWGHERALLQAELPRKTLSQLLEAYGVEQKSILQEVVQSLTDRTQNFLRLFGQGGTGVMAPGEDNSFVKKTLQPKTEKILSDVPKLIATVNAAGAEEWDVNGALAEIQRLVEEDHQKPVGDLDKLKFLPGPSVRLPPVEKSVPTFIPGQPIDWNDYRGDVQQVSSNSSSGKVIVRVRNRTIVVEPAAAGLEEGTATYMAAPVSATVTGEPILTVTALKSELSTVRGVTLPADLQTDTLAFVVAPDGLAKFAAAVTVFGGQGVMADVVALNAAHARKVQDQLEALGLTRVMVYDLETDFSGDLGLALRTLREVHEEAHRKVQMVTAQTGLMEVARFLGTGGAEGAQRAIEAIAGRSNTIWS